MFTIKRIGCLVLLITAAVIIYDRFMPVSPYPAWPKKAIVVGASSGIGAALAEILSKHGYEVGLTARRIDLLQKLQQILPNKSYIKQLDVSNFEQAKKLLRELIDEMQGCHLMVINAGVATDDVERNWDKQKQVLDVNVVGFAAMVHEALEHFVGQRGGHLVGISSIAGLRGGKYAYTYSATKAFDSRLLEGVRNTVRSENVPIFVTDIRPGWVDTAMTINQPHKFWEASPQIAAEQIYAAIQKREKVAYVTKRWGFVALLISYAPDWFFDMVT